MTHSQSRTAEKSDRRLEAKQFHQEGGAIYGLLAKRDRREAIRFIGAYQTINDYLQLVAGFL